MSLGDLPGTAVDNIPWCQIMTPSGGVIDNEVFSRGASNTNTTGGAVAYGLWMPPKVGAMAVITCINGNPMIRVCVGFLHQTATTHTLPHGRYINGDGPFSTEEDYIEPLYSNTQAAFGSDNTSYEWQSRVADRSATKVKVGAVKADAVNSRTADDTSQGYQVSRLAPDLKSNTTGKNYDPQTYSWTSPGFHSIAMDDSIDNCRMRLRTTSGHQILLDDTNERIYIATAEGLNWIELDQDGSFDIFLTQKASIRSLSDINLTSETTVRIFGKQGIHLNSPEGEVRVFSKTGTHLLTDASTRIESAEMNMLTSHQATHILTDTALHVESAAATMMTAGADMNLLAGGKILETAVDIMLNGDPAVPANAEAADAQTAFYTNRVPAHEPWGRSDTLMDSSHAPKYAYTSDKIGKDHKKRNKFWRR
jgi:hypothetical protein